MIINYIISFLSAGLVCLFGAMLCAEVLHLFDAALVMCAFSLIFALLAMISTIVGMWRDII